MGNDPSAGLIEPVYAAEEVAGWLRVSPCTVTRMIRTGQFPGAFKAGRQWRIPRPTWTAYLRSVGAIPAA